MLGITKMSKKIVIKSDECPFRSNVSGNFYCEHPSMIQRYCTWTGNPPPTCPVTTEELRKLKLLRIKNNAEKDSNTTR